MIIVGRYNWPSRSGHYAENFLIKKFFPSLGLRFRKIRKDKRGPVPDGWILRDKQKIALAEIKLIKYSFSNDTQKVHRITIDSAIQDAIDRAKKQLKNFDTELPKILYLIFDDSFANSRSVLVAAFGPWRTIIRDGRIIYNGPRGFHPTQKAEQDNKILGSWLSAIFCYIQDTNKYKLLLFKPQNLTKIPDELMPIEAIQEIWEYSETTIVRTK